MLLQPGAVPSPVIRRRGLRSRLLFHLRARDMSLTPVTGQVPTFTRATAGGLVADRFGRLFTPVHSQPRWIMIDADGDGIRETPSLLIEPQRTNLCTQSENVGAWTVNGTPVLTSGQADPAGGTAAYLVADDDAGVVEFVKAPMAAFTADDVKAISVHIRKGVPGTGHLINLRDVVAVVDRLFATVTWTGIVPSVSVSTGALLLAEALADGSYRLHFQTSTVTAANGHELHVRPCGLNAGEVGSVYLFGAQGENARYPSSYVKTAGSSVTRNADALSYPMTLPFTADTDDLTFYARLARPIYADAVGSIIDNPGILSLGGTNPDIRLYFPAATRQIIGNIRDGASVNVNATANIPAGRILEVCVQVKDLTVTPAVAIDVGAGLSAFATNALAPIASIGSVLKLGTITGGNDLCGSLCDVKVARGLLSLAQMQEAF